MGSAAAPLMLLSRGNPWTQRSVDPHKTKAERRKWESVNPASPFSRISPGSVKVQHSLQHVSCRRKIPCNLWFPACPSRGVKTGPLISLLSVLA